MANDFRLLLGLDLGFGGRVMVGMVVAVSVMIADDDEDESVEEAVAVVVVESDARGDEANVEDL